MQPYEPERWPAGNPDRKFCARDIPFGEVDRSPTKQLLLDHAEAKQMRRFYDLAFAKRPAEELYDLKNDPGQVRNVTADPAYADVQNRLRTELNNHLVKTRDPRALGLPAPWDHYPYYGLRRNKDWKVDPMP